MAAVRGTEVAGVREDVAVFVGMQSRRAAVPLPAGYAKASQAGSWRNICIPTFTAGLFTTALMSISK